MNRESALAACLCLSVACAGERTRQPASEAPNDRLGDAYGVLQGLAPLILEHQGKGTIAGVRPIVAFDAAVDESPQDVRLGEITLHDLHAVVMRPEGEGRQ